MRDKGRIRVNGDADTVLFDPNTMGDQATYEKTGYAFGGMKYVLVSGVPVVW